VEFVTHLSQEEGTTRLWDAVATVAAGLRGSGTPVSGVRAVLGHGRVC